MPVDRRCSRGLELLPATVERSHFDRGGGCGASQECSRALNLASGRVSSALPAGAKRRFGLRLCPPPKAP